eukprot:5096412-Pyramimonas_sp.AAC.1
MATPLRGQSVCERDGYPQLGLSSERTQTRECIHSAGKGMQTLCQLPLSSRSKGRVKKSSGER